MFSASTLNTHSQAFVSTRVARSSVSLTRIMALSHVAATSRAEVSVVSTATTRAIYIAAATFACNVGMSVLP
jgi:hypothetical protein